MWDEAVWQAFYNDGQEGSMTFSDYWKAILKDRDSIVRLWRRLRVKLGLQHK